jgi:hypothetical protein
MKKIITSFFFSFILGALFFISVPGVVHADAACDLCLKGANNDRSQCQQSCAVAPANGAAAQSDSVFGKIDAPKGVVDFNNSADAGVTANGTRIGLIVFISNIIKLATVVAGIWVLFNFITAGFTYITSQGESKAATEVKDQITSSVIGLVFIIGAYTVIALISYFLFADAGYILNPTLIGPK